MKARPKKIWYELSGDQLIALILLPLILVILGFLFVVVVPLQGRPFFFSAQRMRGPKESFVQLKIRTMQPVDRISEQSVMGGDLCHRITPIGAFLRKTRLDELPQIINVLRGEMVFIGPRPPLRKYVEVNAAYANLLSNSLPGITGLATVLLHAREERILAHCKSAAETDKVFREQCIPLKIRMDELYLRRRSLRLKVFILWRTISGLSFLDATLGFCATIWNGARAKTMAIYTSSLGSMSQPSRKARLK